MTSGTDWLILTHHTRLIISLSRFYAYRLFLASLTISRSLYVSYSCYILKNPPKKFKLRNNVSTLWISPPPPEFTASSYFSSIEVRLTDSNHVAREHIQSGIRAPQKHIQSLDQLLLLYS